MKNSEKGQALVLTVFAVGIVLIGAMGLAIDGSQIYAHREMAQAAADAAAEAAVMSIFAGTPGAAWATAGVGYTCSTSSTLTPCVYARNNGFGSTASDSVSVSFPSSPYDGVSGSPNFTYPFVQVTILRTLPTSFMQFFGATSSTVKAIGGAGIVQPGSAVPILVLHPTNADALQLGPKGSETITITGGPSRAIQVNSNSSSAVVVAPSGVIDLSAAGPGGSGADLGVVGPTTQPTSSQLLLGSTGHWVQPAAKITDPFLGLPTPAKPAAGTTSSIPAGTDGCPSAGKSPPPCTLYSPGSYSNIVATRSDTYVFAPGVYYMTAGSFGATGAGSLLMCSGCAADSTTGSGMMVYFSGSSSLNLSNGGSISLVGSDVTSTYKGILFFAAYSSTLSPSTPHSISGDGGLLLKGTIYLTNGPNTTAAQYQKLLIANSGGSSTVIAGEVIADEIELTGAATITMQLSPSYKVPLDQIALVH